MRKDAFRLDLGLRVRMTVALLLSAALLVAGLAFATWIVLEGGWAFVVMFVFVALAGIGKPGRVRGANARPEVRRRAEHAVSRLALVADLTEPETVVKRTEAPLSWTTAVPFRKPRVHSPPVSSSGSRIASWRPSPLTSSATSGTATRCS